MSGDINAGPSDPQALFLGPPRPVRPDEVAAIRETWWRALGEGRALPSVHAHLVIDGGRT